MAFSEIRTQRRITVREASGGDLFKGAVAIAAGTTLISCLTLDISTGLKGALLVVGCLLCLYGAKWVRKYLKDDKTYREYAPEWDDKHFIYDRFAKGLNAWYRQEELPEDADGDIAYFLKLQRERLRNKGLQMEKRSFLPKEPVMELGKDLANPSGILRICFLSRCLERLHFTMQMRRFSSSNWR